MSNKVLLILVDGMRPDSLHNIPFVNELLSKSSYTMNGKAVMPSVTLPCHMSLFHSVDPQRHGVVTNTYTPQVRPINGLCEQLKNVNKKCAFFYNWEELRDLSRPGSLSNSYFVSGDIYTYKQTNITITQNAIEYIKKDSPDFVFLYLGYTDWSGHKYGWMSAEYIQSVIESWKCIEEIINSLPEDYTTIITADHGGHDRSHGTGIAEDMTIPIIFNGTKFKENNELNYVSIKDIAPTIAKLIGCQAALEWEGESVI